MAEIVDLISNLGFPIAMVCYFIYDKTTTLNKVTLAIDNNTQVLSRLLERFDIEDGVSNGQ